MFEEFFQITQGMLKFLDYHCSQFNYSMYDDSSKFLLNTWLNGLVVRVCASETNDAGSNRSHVLIDMTKK